MTYGIQLDRPRCPERKVVAAAAAARLLTTEDVATLTGLSVETLAQWRSQKRGIPYVKISRNCVRYRQSDLDGWLAERIVRTDEDASNRR
jgi:excisionase family DNA binding protein